MKISHSQSKAIVQAERCVQSVRRLRWQVPLFFVFCAGVWFYFGREQADILPFLIFALCVLAGILGRTCNALSSLLQAFQELINADPQALAQQYAAKLDADDPESLNP
jgi:hypothetical protein